MFFIMGITNGEKSLDYVDTVICKSCGKYGRFEGFMTYTALSLFFIPVFKWNKRYYLRTTCCNSIYEISPGLGKSIEGGEDVVIKDEDLNMVNGGRMYRYCSNCGFNTMEDFVYCPKCSEKLM